MKDTSTSIPVGDIEVHCTVVGKGTPLVVVHGGPGLGGRYMRDLDRWADAFQLVYYSQRGSGRTPVGDPAKVSFAGAIDDLNGLSAALGIDHVNLVGHSVGAILAAMYAGTHPESTASVVLLNTAPPLHPGLQQTFGRRLASRRTPEDDTAKKAIEASPQFEARDPKTMERHTLNTYIPFFRNRASIGSLTLGFTEITAANVLAAPKRMFGSLGALDPMQTFARIQCPTLVVHSELDPVPVEWAHALVDTIPGADYILLEGASHFAHIEDAQQLADAVLPWLTKHVG
ncbi:MULTISPECIES: alpha/beta fold hydrolase [Nocardioides]|uniref:Alpha/beta fold hydrolase n=1 Tax=Nocardioides vastitatis TaxID=2568655 RepID=A0ABW0ZAM9_9ACTN|nr:alpha/beta hydrolase [Nocardioides sp.]